MDIQLRPYQKECLEKINNAPPGRYLCNLATGLGKTVIFTNIKRRGRVLLLSHREELVRQPIKYYDCPVGVEMSKETSHGEEVVSASVQSIVRRLDKFKENDFWMIITDECHHGSSKTYRKIYDYFKFDYHIGFTATVNRGDRVRLDTVFDKIIFQRDLRWGITHGYLSDIYCLRCNIGFNLSGVHTQNGDYAPGELDEAMEGTADAIAQAYREHAVGATLIFAVSVRHAQEIASKIPGAVVVTGETKDRAAIIQAFTNGEIPCIVNCMVFTEGTDIPRVETVIMARPTQSDIIYQQAIGRGLRLYPGKERLTLIDCVGVTGSRSLVTAPSLLGIDLDAVPPQKRKEVQGMLFDLPDLATAAADCPQSWIRNTQIVDLWAKDMKYNMHNMNLFRQPDGSLTLHLRNRIKKTIPPADQLGNVTFSNGVTVPMQTALDVLYKQLQRDYPDDQYIWDVREMKRWANKPATENQIKLVQKKCKGFDTDGMTKGQASLILNRVLNR